MCFVGYITLINLLILNTHYIPEMTLYTIFPRRVWIKCAKSLMRYLHLCS